MDKTAFKARTKTYALNVITLVESLPRCRTADVLGKQLLRSATSVAANYRAACRARSNAEFISKMCIVEEEADECLFWFELLIGSGLVKQENISRLLNEGDQIVAMTIASIKTARQRGLNPQSEFRNPQ
ncbi:MAG: four helix bundle protein [Abitibacteriaceae bacterium]|nr:four helix bundle protein [Abditibacteriaceae bacterium]